MDKPTSALLIDADSLNAMPDRYLDELESSLASHRYVSRIAALMSARLFLFSLNRMVSASIAAVHNERKVALFADRIKRFYEAVLNSFRLAVLAEKLFGLEVFHFTSSIFGSAQSLTICA